MATAPLNRVVGYLRRAALRHEGGRLGDGQLLDRFLARRDQGAFEALVRRHGPMVLGVCRRTLGNGHDAEDAFQATFLVLLKKADAVLPRDMVGNWLYGVARRTALKARAAAGRRRRVERQAGRAPGREATPEGTSDDLRQLLDEELHRLPQKYRAPLVLCLLEGKPRKEAAGLLGWTEGTLSGRLARAKAMLAARLTRRGLALSGAALALPAVPAPLTAATVKAALPSAAWPATGVVSARVIALTEEVMKAMLTTKLKAAAGVLLVAATLGLGAGTVAWQTRATAEGPPAAAAGARPADASADRAKEQDPYVIEPPDILLVQYESERASARIRDKHLVRPDGTVGLGPLGSVFVGGMTVAQAREAIGRHLADRVEDFDARALYVDVAAYNSKVYYVITDAGGGDQVLRLPCTGAETVLDAVSQANLPLAGLSRKRVWVERSPGKDGQRRRTLPVDWKGIVQDGATATNYQLVPGDRVYVREAAERPAAAADEGVVYLKSRECQIPFLIAPEGSRVKRLELFASEDRGRTYRLVGAATPEERHFRFQAARDGVYWLIVRSQTEKGETAPPSAGGEPPSLKLCIDTRPPVVFLKVSRTDDALALRWSASDEDLNVGSLVLEFREVGGQEWVAVDVKRAPTGRHVWTPPGNVLAGPVELRLSASDKAGNTAQGTATVTPP